MGCCVSCCPSEDSDLQRPLLPGSDSASSGFGSVAHSISDMNERTAEPLEGALRPRSATFTEGTGAVGIDHGVDRVRAWSYGGSRASYSLASSASTLTNGSKCGCSADTLTEEDDVRRG